MKTVVVVKCKVNCIGCFLVLFTTTNALLCCLHLYIYTEAAALITQELRKAMFKRLLQMVRHFCIYIVYITVS
jgi:hypothetical protein